jgi:hypothetical protein
MALSPPVLGSGGGLYGLRLSESSFDDCNMHLLMYALIMSVSAGLLAGDGVVAAGIGAALAAWTRAKA